MAEDHLKQADLFLPEECWGELELQSSSNPWMVLAAGAAAIAACALIVIGDGGPVTWIAAVAFVLVLFGYTILAIRGVEGQNRRVRKLLDGEKLEREGNEND